MRRVAVTGASRGIGAASALLLAGRGFRVVVNHRASAPQAEEVVAAVTAAGDEAVAIQADVTSFADLSWEQLGGKLHRELRAAFLITKAVVPGMISRGYGRLVYLSTGLSRRPRDGMITLGTAKAALAGAAI